MLQLNLCVDCRVFMHTTVYVSCVGLALATLPEIQCARVHPQEYCVHILYSHKLEKAKELTYQKGFYEGVSRLVTSN